MRQRSGTPRGPGGRGDQVPRWPRRGPSHRGRCPTAGRFSPGAIPPHGRPPGRRAQSAPLPPRRFPRRRQRRGWRAVAAAVAVSRRAGRRGRAGAGRGRTKGAVGQDHRRERGARGAPLLTLPCARDAAGTAGPGERRGPGGTRAAPFRGGSGGNPAALSGQTQAALPGRCGVPRAAGGAGTRRLTCSPAPRRAPGRSRAAPPHLRPREAGSMPCNKRGGRVWTLCPRAGKRPAPAAQPRQGPASLRRMLRAPVRFVLNYGVLSK